MSDDADSSVFMERTVTGLKAGDERAVHVLRRVPVGELVLCKITNPRNLAHHKKFMKLLDVFWEAAGDWSSPYAVLVELKCRLGHIQKLTIRETGEIMTVPRSISFAAMDQTAFETFYEKAINELCVMAGGIEPSELREAVLMELSHA